MTSTAALEHRNARAARYIESAQTAFEAGFRSKAAQKDAIDSLNRAYDIVRDFSHGLIIDGAPYHGVDWSALTPDEQDARHDERHAYFDAREQPFGLHQVRDRHLPVFAQYGDCAWVVQQLIDLRAAVKAAPVTPPQKDAEVAAVEAAQKSVLDLIKTRQAQYENAVALGELFGGLPVTMNWHYVQNQYNTIFPRCFFYLDGKLTPLNVLVAASQELERRKAG
jgi:hypothetical protein